MPQNKLAYISGETPAKSAIVVIGGIHDTYEHFKSWNKDLSAPDTLVVGFDHDHQSSTMTEASRKLANAIEALQVFGVEEVTVVAHSMGGLVGKAALDHLAESGVASRFTSIDFHAMGTPWGGFALAGIPGSSYFGPKIGYPMSGEMSPGSDFMERLSKTSWPDNMSFTVYQGSADNVSLPSVLATHERYDEITGRADVIVTLEGYNHTDYVRAGADVLNAGKEPDAPGAEQARALAVQDRQTEEEAGLEMD